MVLCQTQLATIFILPLPKQLWTKSCLRRRTAANPSKTTAFSPVPNPTVTKHQQLITDKVKMSGMESLSYYPFPPNPSNPFSRKTQNYSLFLFPYYKNNFCFLSLFIYFLKMRHKDGEEQRRTVQFCFVYLYLHFCCSWKPL